MTRKKPWNRVNLPVYSVASRGDDGFNMHICTYATAISMQPKRFAVCIYKGTKTLDNINEQPHFVLQVLSKNQFSIVNLLGKKSGKKVDKMKILERRKLLDAWEGFKILRDSLAVINLKVINSFDGGDHIVFVCDVQKYKNLNEGEELSLKTLREKKIITV